jgi:hypothetical protein
MIYQTVVEKVGDEIKLCLKTPDSKHKTTVVALNMETGRIFLDEKVSSATQIYDIRVSNYCAVESMQEMIKLLEGKPNE